MNNQEKITLVEGVIAGELGRGDSDTYAANYTWIAEKIVTALDGK